MAKSKQKLGEWELSAETIHAKRGAWGLVELELQDDPKPWRWLAEGGKRGPAEGGYAATREHARRMVEWVLGLRAEAP